MKKNGKEIQTIKAEATVSKNGIIKAYFRQDSYHGISARFKYANFIEPNSTVEITIKYIQRDKHEHY